jgi:formate-dependent nitrite reductase membrane component NrfD
VGIRTLAVAALLVVAAATLARALVSRDGVGPAEWVAGVVIVLGLLYLALRVSRPGVSRG